MMSYLAGDDYDLDVDTTFCVGNSHALIVAQHSATSARCACGKMLRPATEAERRHHGPEVEVWVHDNGKVSCPLYTCPDCGRQH